MIEIDSISITNFGPYYGSHSLDLRRNKGVLVVYGGNGFGKTSLLNAFRWAFTGQVKGRIESSTTNNFVNRKAIRESGDSAVDCSVEVKFWYSNVLYHLKRCILRNPNGQSEMKMSLAENEVLLNESDSYDKVSQLMPVEVQQFFFFDGELINQFEKLLDQSSESAAELKRAIEAVLGIPKIRESASIAKKVITKISKALFKMKDTSSKNKKLYEQITRSENLEEAAAAKLDETENLIRVNNDKLHEIDESLKQIQSTKTIVEEKNSKIALLKSFENEWLRTKEAMSKKMKTGAWRVVLDEFASSEIERLKIEVESLEKGKNRHLVTKTLQYFRDHYDSSGICLCCGSDDLGFETTGTLLLEDSSLLELEREISEVSGPIEFLLKVRGDSELKALSELSGNEKSSRNEVGQLQNRLNEIEEELDSVEEGSVEDLINSRSGLLGEKSKLEKSKADLIEKIKVENKKVEYLRKQLENEDNSVAKLKQSHINLLTDIAAFFDKAASAYRDDQRSEVEEHATEIFLKTVHQSDYSGLQINESYGLQIVHNDDGIEYERSAGYEHIVALSLIGALQRCSPVKGLVVMDSPFGRLDKLHGENVIRVLPDIADQVLLLVTDREMEEGSISTMLSSSSVIGEYRLNHVSARETLIESLEGV